MPRNLPYVLASLTLIGVLVFAFTRIGAGPDVTGPEEAQVRVDDVPNHEGRTERVGGDDGDIWALPEGFRQLLDRDAIFPIYDPVFVPAAESDWPDNALVVGVALNGEARAYPVGHLNRREMVIDTVGGVPVLVSW